MYREVSPEHSFERSIRNPADRSTDLTIRVTYTSFPRHSLQQRVTHDITPCKFGDMDEAIAHVATMPFHMKTELTITAEDENGNEKDCACMVWNEDIGKYQRE